MYAAFYEELQGLGELTRASEVGEAQYMQLDHDRIRERSRFKNDLHVRKHLCESKILDNKA